MTPEQEIEIGERARRLYEQIKPRFDLIRDNIIDLWSLTKTPQIEEREALYHKLHALLELERSFKNDMDTGTLASKQLEAENARNN